MINDQHEEFCKVFKPAYGTIFNMDTVQFEPLGDKYYTDAQRLNWAFAGWIQSANRQGYKLVPVDSLNEIIECASCHINDRCSGSESLEVYKHIDALLGVVSE